MLTHLCCPPFLTMSIFYLSGNEGEVGSASHHGSNPTNLQHAKIPHCPISVVPEFVPFLPKWSWSNSFSITASLCAYLTSTSALASWQSLSLS